ncbi:TetR/AcrR family transcriptional regulator, partial [Glycomyces tenuis]
MPVQDASERSRADARRNRARVLDAARRAFAREGAAVSLGEIARRAGVGAGTVYRHFPTKESLFEAVMSQRIEGLVRLAETYGDAEDPGAAFFDFVTKVITSAPDNKLLCELLDAEDGWPRAALLSSGRRFEAALRSLLAAAQRDGAVRPELDEADVQLLFTGCVAMQRLQKDPSRLAPMTALAIAALRPGEAVTNPANDRKIRDESAGAAENRNAARPVCGACGRPLATAGPGRPAR